MTREEKLNIIKEVRENTIIELNSMYHCSDPRDGMYHAAKLTAYATIMTAFLADL